MEIAEGIKVKACWEVVEITRHDRHPEGVIDFQVLINGEYLFLGSAFKDDSIILETTDPDGVNIILAPGEDHPVRRDLANCGYTVPYSNYEENYVF